MNRPRGRFLGLSIAALGVCVVVACGVVFKDRLAEEWWLHKLESEDKEEQIVAVERLADMGAVRAVPVIFGKLRHNSPVLLYRYDPFSGEVDLLYPVSWSNDEDVFWHKVRIRGTGGLSPTPADAPKEFHLVKALWRITEVSGQACVPCLTSALGDESWNARYLSAALLGWLGADGAAAVPALIATLKHSASSVHAEVHSGVGIVTGDRHPDGATLETLLRHQIVGARGQIGPEAREALPILVDLVEDEKDPVRQAAAEALRRIQGHEQPKR